MEAKKLITTNLNLGISLNLQVKHEINVVMDALLQQMSVNIFS